MWLSGLRLQHSQRFQRSSSRLKNTLSRTTLKKSRLVGSLILTSIAYMIIPRQPLACVLISDLDKSRSRPIHINESLSKASTCGGSRHSRGVGEAQGGHARAGLDQVAVCVSVVAANELEQLHDQDTDVRLHPRLCTLRARSLHRLSSEGVK